MVKKALIVGVSEYEPLGADLKSSLIEIEQWRHLLLREYSFADDNIRLLKDRRATRSTVMDRLMWLLSNAEDDDQLVFIFCGHGTRARGKDSGGRLRNFQNEALVPFPAGAADPLDIAISDDDLTELYCSMSVPPGALTTLILDCCFSAGIDFSEQGIVRKAIRNYDEWGPANVLRFGLRITQSVHAIHPLVIAASGEVDVAFEVPDGDRTRSLFSFLAIDALRRNPKLSYQDLITTIAPRMLYAAQEPCLRGDTNRMKEQFLQ